MSDLYHKQKFAGIDVDSDVRGLQPGKYRMLNNGIPVGSKITSSLVSPDGNISSVAGNELVSFSLPAGTNRVIGALEDRVGNRVFYFVANTTPANDAIYQYILGTGITLVMQSSLLGLSGTTFVSADIVGDLLTFTNNVGEIKQINVADAIAGGVYTPYIEEISLMKKAPVRPITTLTTTAANRNKNNIRYNTFQFYWRFVYRDNAYSAFSPASPALHATGPTWDAIVVTAPIGATPEVPPTVTKIEFAFRKNGTNEMVIYRSDSFPLVTNPHLFYNDTSLETVPDSEAIKWYDSVPLKSKALKFHENRLFLFGNTEGYTLTGDKLTGATAGTTGRGAYAQQPILKDNSVYGVSVQFYDQLGRIIGLRKVTDVVTPSRDSQGVNPASNKILVDLSSVATANIPSDAYHYSVLRTKNKSVSNFISGPTSDVWFRKLKTDGTYQWSKGAPLFDEVLVDISNLLKLEMGYTFNEGDRLKLWDSNGTSFIDVPITGQDGRYVIARHSNVGSGPITLDTTRGDVLVFEIYTPKTNSFELYYEVGHRESINNPGTGTRAFNTTSVVIDGDTYLASRNSTGPAGAGYLTYEDIGSGYSYTNPLDNDEKYRTGGTGGITYPDLFYSLVAENKNPNWSIWADGVGRGISYDADGASQIVKKSVRFSNEYIQNSRILGLNTFEALNEQYLPVDNGTPYALAAAGDVLMALFDIEAVALYIGEGFISTAEGNQFLAKSDQVIGDDRRYTGSYGTVHPATVVSRNDRVYWLDTKRQVVLRRAQNGITVISDYGVRNLIGNLCHAYNSLPEANYRITAGWDPQYDCYTLCFNDLLEQNIEDSMTLYFHEATNSWVCRTDLRPEFFSSIFNRQIHFLSGALWVQSLDTNYNKFFSTQYNRRLDWEIAPQESLEKIWEAIEVDADEIYVTAGTNEVIVSLYPKNGATLEARINYLDFKERAGLWWSPFFQSLNDEAFATETESKYKSPHKPRGQSAYLVITYNGTDRNQMKSISVFYRPSMKTFV